MGNSVFSKEIEGIPSNWNIIEKNYNEQYNNRIKSVCEKIKKISDSKDNIEKFENFVESNGNIISLGSLVKLGKVCGYLSPCATVIVLYFDLISKDAEETIKLYCKSEVAMEISNFLGTILQTHLKEALRNIEYDKNDFASDHCSTSITFVEICYEKGDLERWYDSIEKCAGGLQMLINILSITKIISDIYLGLVQLDYLEKETLRIENLINKLKKLVVNCRYKSIVITTSTIPIRYKRVQKPKYKYSSEIIDKLDGYTFTNRGATIDGATKYFNKYKSDIYVKWTIDINNMCKNNNDIFTPLDI